jgi:hypothetical protein
VCNLRCRLKVDLLDEDQIKDTFEPQIKVLPLPINKISDPLFTPTSPFLLEQAWRLAYHVEFRILRLPLACGGI